MGIEELLKLKERADKLIAEISQPYQEQLKAEEPKVEEQKPFYSAAKVIDTSIEELSQPWTQPYERAEHVLDRGVKVPIISKEQAEELKQEEQAQKIAEKELSSDERARIERIKKLMGIK